jgi:hypothetical protein
VSVLRRAAVAAWICVLVQLPSTAHPLQDFGVVAFDLRDPVPAKLAQLRVGIVRGSCNWETLEPARGVFRWDCADNVILGAFAAGIRSYLTVTCTPAWATSGGSCARLPDDISDWYALVARIVARYSRFGTTLGIWNEPNLTLADASNGGDYALLYMNASRARDTVNAQFPLAGPETSHHALASGYFARAVDTIASMRAFEPQDVLAVHWYPDGPPLDEYLAAVHDVSSNREVWLSETGMSSPDPDVQAAFYGRMLDEFGAPTRPWWWTHIIFYRLWDGTDCCSDAILRADYTSKPAYDIFRSWLEAHEPVRPQPLPPRPIA